MDALSILSAVGFGALLTIPLQYYFNERAKRKTMLFQEKKEAFVGLLTAYRSAAVEPTEKTAKEFAYWQIRCELICSQKTKNAIQSIVDTNDDRDARKIALENMKLCFSEELNGQL